MRKVDVVSVHEAQITKRSQMIEQSQEFYFSDVAAIAKQPVLIAIGESQKQTHYAVSGMRGRGHSFRIVQAQKQTH